MMKNLGKILILFFIPHAIYASVKASLDTHYVELGDTVTYSLSISGDDVKNPNIQTICGVDVISTSSQRNIQMINTNVTKTITFSYQFVPQKSCEIPPVEIEVDSKLQKSNAESLKIVPHSALKQDAVFTLNMSSSKKEVMVGEPFKVTLLFKQREDSKAIDSQFTPPQMDGFWIKGESQPIRYRDGRYNITKVIYTLSAQRVGTLKIPKAQIRIANRVNNRDGWGMWMSQVKWKAYFSNELNIDVKELPEGIKLIGNFNINTKVDKTKIHANEALNLVIEVKGNGNLEDIKSFKPYINGVNVFDEKIVIKGNKLTQKMAFVADGNFTVPPFTLKYFDTKTKQIKTISTQKIYIEVEGSKVNTPLTIKRSDNSKTEDITEVKEEDINSNKSSLFMLGIAFITGLLIGISLMMIKYKKYKKKKKVLDTKDPKLLFIKLLPYKDDKDVREIMDILENNIYSDKKQKIDKKALKKVLKQYEL